MKMRIKQDIPDMQGIPQSTEADHYGSSFHQSAPARRSATEERRRKDARTDTIIWVVLLVICGLEIGLLWYFQPLIK